MKRIWLLVLLMAGSLTAALSSPALAKEASDDSSDAMEDVNQALGGLSSRLNDVEKKQSLAVEIHGFAETDMIGDSTQSFAETVGNGAVKLPGQYPGDNGYTQFSLRNSRISLLGQGVEVDGWKTKGYMEADFLGYDPGPVYAATAGVTTSATVASGNNEYKFYTQPTFRLRHAYMDAQKDGWEILVGQWWTLFGWNMDYVLSTVSLAPVMGTLYERTPQLRVMKTFGNSTGFQVQLAVDAEKPEQYISEMPNLNGGVRFLMNDITGRFTAATGAAKLVPLSLGFSETNANYVWANNTYPTGYVDTGNFTYQNMWGSAVAVDALIPVVPVSAGKDDFGVVLTGEWTYGAGDTDEFNGGGFSGLSAMSTASPNMGNLDPGVAGLDNGNNFVLVLLQSVTGQIQITLPPSIGTIVTAGYGEIYSPNDVQLNKSPGFKLTGVYDDDSCMFANIMQDFTSNIRAGVEYARFDTRYLSGADAIDHRIQLSTWYRF